MARCSVSPFRDHISSGSLKKSWTMSQHPMAALAPPPAWSLLRSHAQRDRECADSADVTDVTHRGSLAGWEYPVHKNATPTQLTAAGRMAETFVEAPLGFPRRRGSPTVTHCRAELLVRERRRRALGAH